ncbi:MAG: DNA/RNA nuclease SfsA [Candidatus Marinimicrobia bacterium]|nr:DNA/RNA nuclease SfsA [Candidatus Neomarinimicrobiota bacterium]|tara:strand:- start:5855 stop:6559 length:705 start_codon:yes stop_codon:yes gene_type:complete
MKIDGPLHDAVFIKRLNRFLTLIDIGGKIFESHLPDSGRLSELLIPGSELKVRYIDTKLLKRKTSWTTLMVKKHKQWISIDSTLPNRFVKYLLEKKSLPQFKDYELKRPEVVVGKHRFDFLLEKLGKPFYLEVKSVTFVEKSLARFPDAITERGMKHANFLAQMSEKGNKAGILFVCQRSDAQSFRPMWNRDPKFSQALLLAEKAGVQINVIVTKITPTSINYYKEISYDLEPF